MSIFFRLAGSRRGFLNRAAYMQWIRCFRRGGANWKDHPERAAASLREAAGIGNVVAASGDHTLKESIDGIARTDPQLRAVAAKGYLDLQRGRALYVADKPAEARVALQSAAHLLELADSPLRWQAHLSLSAAAYVRNGYDEALEEIQRIETDPRFDERRFGAIAGHLHWMRGLIALAQGRAGDSLREYQHALTLFQALHERENTGAVLNLIAENFDFLGMAENSWRARRQAIVILADAGAQRRLDVALQEAAQAGVKDPMFSAFSLLVSSRLVQIAKANKSAPAVVDAFVWRALAQKSSQQVNIASESIAAARTALSTIRDDGLRLRAAANVDSAEAEVFAETDPDRALLMAARAIAFYRLDHNRFRLAELSLGRARSFRRLGNREGLLAACEDGIREIEDLRTGLAEESERVAYMDVRLALFDELLEAQAEGNEWKEFFRTMERSRSRTLLDAITSNHNGAHGMPADLSQIAGSLPEHVTLIEYAVLPGRIVAVGIRRNSFTTRNLTIPHVRLQALVLAMRLAIASGDLKSLPASSLFDLILRPFNGFIGDQDVLVVVPDDELHSVPFAALYDVQQRRFLCERFAVAIAPSSAIFVRLDRDHSRTSSPRTLVAAYGEGISEDPLSSVPVEVGAIAGALENVDVLDGSAATVAAFKAAAPRYGIIHFAGHTIATDEVGSVAIRLASNDGTGTALLTLKDLAQMNLRSTGLVVLSACRTADGGRSQSEGAISLSRAFLRAGVPSVIGSLYKVEDSETAAFFTIFYRCLRQDHMRPVQALRAAQIAAIRSPSTSGSPAWAAFVMFGSI